MITPADSGIRVEVNHTSYMSGVTWDPKLTTQGPTTAYKAVGETQTFNYSVGVDAKPTDAGSALEMRGMATYTAKNSSGNAVSQPIHYGNMMFFLDGNPTWFKLGPNGYYSQNRTSYSTVPSGNTNCRFSNDPNATFGQMPYGDSAYFPSAVTGAVKYFACKIDHPRPGPQVVLFNSPMAIGIVQGEPAGEGMSGAINYGDYDLYEGTCANPGSKVTT